ncbi:SusC/RagA family TonB-linked outer membrane protein [Pedobacter gandavensis]|uniref:SusC/RagA family TonB-linked outer membrane protein n=1 Tax=Pedobacter gandavensis TaxID=2679963 RepID=UPI00292CBAF2|nr:SusC/RagA family TonB-linked outer membrane protein [Pedobacter gandavensis]
MNIYAFNNTMFQKSGTLCKFMLVMKITAVLLLVGLLQVSAASLAQKINIQEKNATLKSVIEKVRIQSGYNFLYIENVLNLAKPVDVQLKNVDFEEALVQIFTDQPLDYEIKGNTVVIRKKEAKSTRKSTENQKSLSDITINGKVVDEKGQGLPGASIRLKGDHTNVAISTSSSGTFSVRVPGKDAILIVSYVGYKTKEVSVSGADADFVIRMEPITAELEGVNIVSTGYQSLPKERATGSFVKIDNDLINRSTGTNILPRLEGVTSGLLFDKRSTGGESTLGGLSIRGLSTLDVTRKAPLIVVDNFPYDGDIKNLNPNDVESITVLKDAAAASIWGARAGNGVIVITTKKGSYNQPLNISFNSNLTVIPKPDLFYFRQISSPDLIDLQTTLFNNGAFDAKINDTSYPVLPAVVEILANARKIGTPAAMDQAKSQIDALRTVDSRNDYLKYVYRDQVKQQYALNINGGNQQINYLIATGYDKNKGDVVNQNNDRLNLRSNINFKPIKNLEIQTGLMFTQSNNYAMANALLWTPQTILPYTQLADNLGNPLQISKDFRTSYVNNLTDQRLVDWRYFPLNDLNTNSKKTKQNDWLLNANAKYDINSIFSTEVKYQYEKAINRTNEYFDNNAYYTRHLYNLYTQPVGSPNQHPIPSGGILNQNSTTLDAYKVRGQINANKTWNQKHVLNAIGGFEINQSHTSNSISGTTYGYDDNILTYKNVDFYMTYPYYIAYNRGTRGTIPNAQGFLDQTYRYTSLYANAAYTYNNLYTLSASIRKDASNLFGVSTNQRGQPFWSTGASWNLSNESFYNIAFLPYLKLRATYGIQGNVNNGLSAYSTILYQPPSGITPFTFAFLKNPDNLSLRWEKVGQLNLGIDFGLKNNRLSGSLEYYEKRITDLLALSPLDYISGFISTTLNAASMRGTGVDLQLHSVNLNRTVTWSTDFLLSYQQNKVTEYLTPTTPTVNSYLNDVLPNPIPGKPAYSIFAFKWAGLNPENGNPRGYLNGQISENYTALTNPSFNDLQYMGSAVPVYYGSLRNTVSWKKLDLSANVIFKFDYYFRKTSIDYSNLVTNGIGHGDFSNRWLNPGDETKTDVPSLIYSPNAFRDTFYTSSEILVSKADHIRLQDITLSYHIQKSNWYLKNIKVYGNVSNVGILWRANKQNLDPDYSSYPVPRTVSIGISGNL